MKETRKKSFCLAYGKKKAFTLIELTFAICISLILIFILGNLLKGSVEYSEKFTKNFKQSMDISFVLDGVMDEIVSADKILKMEERQMDICIFPNKERKEFLYVRYQVYKKNLYRYAIHSNTLVDSINWGTKEKGVNILLYGVDSLSFKQDNNLLTINWTINKRLVEQKVALRGEKL